MRLLSIKTIPKGGGIDLPYFIRSSFWVTLGQIISMALGLLLSVAFARLTTPQLYGSYQYILALIGFFSVFSVNGLNLAVIKSIIARQERALIRAVRFSFISSLLAWFPLLVIVIYFLREGQTRLAGAIGLGALLLPALYATNTWSSFWEAKKKFRQVAWRVFIKQTSLALGLIIALYFNASLIVLVGLWAGIQAVFQLYFYEQTASLAVGGDELDVRYGLKITGQKFSQTLTGTLPAMLIALFWNYDQVAIFGVSFALITFAASLSTTAMSVYLPRFFESKHWRASMKPLLVWLGLGVVLALMFYLGLRVFFFPLYGLNYAASFHILRWLAPFVVLFPVRAYLGHLLTSQGYNWWLICFNLTSHGLGAAWLWLAHDRLPFVPVAACYYITLGILPLAPMLVLFWWQRRGLVTKKNILA